MLQDASGPGQLLLSLLHTVATPAVTSLPGGLVLGSLGLWQSGCRGSEPALGACRAGMGASWSLTQT